MLDIEELKLKHSTAYLDLEQDKQGNFEVFLYNHPKRKRKGRIKLHTKDINIALQFFLNGIIKVYQENIKAGSVMKRFYASYPNEYDSELQALIDGYDEGTSLIIRKLLGIEKH